MATYIGYFVVNADYGAANGARMRAEGPSSDPKFIERIVSLPAALPPGTRMVGTWSAMSTGPVFGGQPLPGFTIVESDDVAGLSVINNHYAGYLNFQWTPANVLPPSTAGRQEWQKEQGA